MLRLLLIFATLFVVADARAEVPATSPSDAALPKIRIALVGDSTVAVQSGWGPGFAACFSDQAAVTDLARNGRSSMSFINEGVWKQCLDLKPDYVLIQFGHNDQKLEDPKRGTIPQTTYRKYMTQYVDEARAAGITPILVTSLSRRQWGDDGKIHSNLGPYVDVVKEIAATKHVPLIDLHALSIDLYEKLGREEVNTMSALTPSTAPATDPTQKKASTIDNTHLNAKGAKVIGQLVANELAKAVPALAPYLVKR
jgi:lysophospholipase L1-like esterase